MAQIASHREDAEAWLAEDPDPTTAGELRALLAACDAGDPAARKDLAERFTGTLEFGTAGLRGILGAGPQRMNRVLVRKVTAGLAAYLLEHAPDARTRGVVIGHDARHNSRAFAEDTARVLGGAGIRSYLAPRPWPTPTTAWATVKLGACAGVMVTASHNPPEYNGYKVYWQNGAQIIPPHDTGIAAEIARVGAAREVPILTPAEARAQGLWRDLDDSVGRAYLAAIAAQERHAGGPGRDFAIVYTAMHGVGGVWVRDALAQAGFARVHLVAEQFEPDGAFPTVRFPNPEEPGALDLSLALAEASSAELILANDPDADRLAVVARKADGKLTPLTGNEVGVLLGHYCLTETRPRPARASVMTTIVSSPQLGVIARDLGALYDE